MLKELHIDAHKLKSFLLWNECLIDVDDKTLITLLEKCGKTSLSESEVFDLALEIFFNFNMELISERCAGDNKLILTYIVSKLYNDCCYYSIYIL